MVSSNRHTAAGIELQGSTPACGSDSEDAATAFWFNRNTAALLQLEPARRAALVRVIERESDELDARRSAAQAAWAGRRARAYEGTLAGAQALLAIGYR